MLTVPGAEKCDQLVHHEGVATARMHNCPEREAISARNGKRQIQEAPLTLEFKRVPQMIEGDIRLDANRWMCKANRCKGVGDARPSLKRFQPRRGTRQLRAQGPTREANTALAQFSPWTRRRDRCTARFLQHVQQGAALSGCHHKTLSCLTARPSYNICEATAVD